MTDLHGWPKTLRLNDDNQDEIVWWMQTKAEADDHTHPGEYVRKDVVHTMIAEARREALLGAANILKDVGDTLVSAVIEGDTPDEARKAISNIAIHLGRHVDAIRALAEKE